jgi:hypothetical protein
MFANRNHYTELGEVHWTAPFHILTGQPPLTALSSRQTFRDEQSQTHCSL